MTDRARLPLGELLTAGQTHESMAFKTLMNTVKMRGRRRPEVMAGDKGCSDKRIQG